MEIYIIVLIYILFLVFFYDVRKVKKNESFHYYFLLSLFIAIAGFSYRLGIDCVRYEYAFTHISKLNNAISSTTEETEYGWNLLNYMFSKFFGVFWALKLFIAAFFNTIVFWFLKKHSKHFFTSILIYAVISFWNFNFEVLRECLSIGFVLIGIDFLLREKKSYKYYYLFCSIACIFHQFAFLSFLFPFAKFIKQGSSLYIVIIVTFVVGVFLEQYFGEFLMLNLLADKSASRLTNYMESSMYGYVERDFLGYVRMCVRLLAMIIVLRWSKKTNSIIMGLALSFIIITILSSFVYIFYRINNYLFFPLIIAITNIQFARKAVIKPVFVTLLCSFFFLPYVTGYFDPLIYRKYIPYVSIFNPQKIAEREMLYY